ncbi:MAG: hypothetical protein ACLQQM_04600 [Acidimicrobiales bacterium]
MILPLSGYDKGDYPSERSQRREIAANALRHRTPCPAWSEPDVGNAPLVNDIKRHGVRVPKRLRSANTARS